MNEHYGDDCELSSTEEVVTSFFSKPLFSLVCEKSEAALGDGSLLPVHVARELTDNTQKPGSFPKNVLPKVQGPHREKNT